MSRPAFMLAERGTVADLQRLAARGFWFDLKIDGIRALATVGPPAGDEPAVTLLSRNGLDLTGRYPEVQSALESLGRDGGAAGHLAADQGGAAFVLDGEIAVPGPDGLPSWPLTHRRTAQRGRNAVSSSDPAAVLYVFDVLQWDGDDLRSTPLRERRRMLDDLCPAFPSSLTVTPIGEDFEGTWDFVNEQHLEGLIAKNPDSRYVAGRTRDWVKVKAIQTVTCLVGGVDWAPEAPTEPRSLQLFLVDGVGELVPIGKASAGVSPAIRPALLHGLRNPPLIVEVEYTQLTPSKVLRNPVIRGVRTDVDVLDCSTDQLR